MGIDEPKATGAVETNHVETGDRYGKYGGPEGLKSVQIFTVDDSNRDDQKMVANWDEIDKIFSDNPAVANKPLKLVVICGAPRIGKSTFASLLYLNNEPIYQNSDNNDNNNNNTKTITKIFETSGKTFRANTKGVWITPVPIPVRERPDSDILYNVFIVDVEGILGPNSDQFIYQQLYVLSSMMSSHFIYYLRHPFNEYHEQVLQLYTTLAQTVQSLNDKLILMASNLINQQEFRYGRVDSDKYVDILNSDSNINLTKFTKYFKCIDCYLMPEPADRMRTGMLKDSDTYYTSDDVGHSYLKYVHEFRQLIMATTANTGADNGLKTSTTTGQPINGRDFHRALRPLFDLITTTNRLEKLPNEMSLLAADFADKLIQRLIEKYQQSIGDCYEQYMYNGLAIDLLDSRHTELVGQLLDDLVHTDNPYCHWSKSADGLDNTAAVDSSRLELIGKLDNQYDRFARNARLYRNCLNSYTDAISIGIRQMIGRLAVNPKLDGLNRELQDLNSVHSKRVDSWFREQALKANRQQHDSDYDFGQLLDKHIDGYYGLNESNLLAMGSAVYRYESELLATKASKGWLNGMLNGSNQWIHAHNEVIRRIGPDFAQRLAANSARYADKVSVGILASDVDYLVEFSTIIAKRFDSNSGLNWALEIGSDLLASSVIIGLGALAVPEMLVIGIPYSVYACIKWARKPTKQN
ncbi:uncharacterized protein LOC128965044 [Oppia nitens]|uniref:uncharacterized protein LOC128965044 n=1 Tax=Oppia nitens TaxID=1686743 RepID=UPI0023DA31A5|nr:uncharacterized protein LOC128965044 [Oppia nitens]